MLVETTGAEMVLSARVLHAYRHIYIYIYIFIYIYIYILEVYYNVGFLYLIFWSHY